MRMKQASHARSEQELLRAVEHPFIVNLWGAFQDSSNLYMVMDFVPGGELFALIRRAGVRRHATPYSDPAHRPCSASQIP